jgi:hypothetical protein
MSRLKKTMSNPLKRLLMIGLTNLCLLGGFAQDTEAQTKLLCQMKGQWIEAKDNFEFQANYLIKYGADTLSGYYVNESARAAANVNGTASQGTWTISLVYTDAQHKNYQKDLIGQGSRKDNNTILIKGQFTGKKNGVVVERGTFFLEGHCK